MEAVPSADMVSQEFLEKCVGRKIESYKLTHGTNAGDNYTSNLYSIEVEFPTKLPSGDKEKAYLIVKCYPANPARQVYPNQCNLFWKEMAFYQQYIPKLIQMQKDLNMTQIMQPPFPALVSAQATDFFADSAATEKVFSPFDNYILMVDIRKTFGFKMTDRLKTWDKDHVSLFMESMARNHALSWVYKQKHNLEKITDHFPFMKNEYSPKTFMDVVGDIALEYAKKASDTVETALGKDSHVTKGAQRFATQVFKDVVNIHYGVGEKQAREYENYLRVKPQIFQDEKPWKVGVLGDVWSNNMLFTYNKDTGKPEEIMHVDFQFCGERCPTTDLVYLVYASTDSKFRKLHLDEMLNLYAEKFKSVCQHFSVEPLPNFSPSELKRRFHRSKLYGYAAALLVFPGSMEDPEDAIDMEQQEGNMNEMFSRATNKRYIERVVALSNDMYEDGII